HLYGQMADVGAVQALAARHGLAVVEDAAQAQGATRDGHGIGHGSAAAATSFYPGKNLGAYGDAGAVVTDDAGVADAVRLLGNHGSRHKYVHESIGFNSRLDTLQAVVLRAKLTRLEDWNERRRAAADRYTQALLGTAVQCLQVDPANLAVWHLYVVRVEAAARDQVLAALAAARIGAGIHYPTPVHLHPAFAGLGHGPGAFPVAEQAAARMLSLPLHPTLTAAEQNRVVSTVLSALAPAPQPVLQPARARDQLVPATRATTAQRPGS
ncbi:MAG TPA: DegT/DnrJ/EryC1/StrS family aminotransferase, partial [Actinomycetales bacterium]